MVLDIGGLEEYLQGLLGEKIYPDCYGQIPQWKCYYCVRMIMLIKI